MTSGCGSAALYYTPSDSSPPAKISPRPPLPPRSATGRRKCCFLLTPCFGFCSLPFSATPRLRVEVFSSVVWLRLCRSVLHLFELFATRDDSGVTLAPEGRQIVGCGSAAPWGSQFWLRARFPVGAAGRSRAQPGPCAPRRFPWTAPASLTPVRQASPAAWPVPWPGESQT
jgi:hypothetical protein